MAAFDYDHRAVLGVLCQERLKLLIHLLGFIPQWNGPRFPSHDVKIHLKDHGLVWDLLNMNRIWLKIYHIISYYIILFIFVWYLFHWLYLLFQVALHFISATPQRLVATRCRQHRRPPAPVPYPWVPHGSVLSLPRRATSAPPRIMMSYDCIWFHESVSTESSTNIT